MLSTSNYQELLLWLLRLRQRFCVTGNSMFPILKAGEEVLVDTKAYRRYLPGIGDLVIAWHPQKENLRIIKRVVKVDEKGNCFLMGENSLESSDSRSFGWVSSQKIIAKVTSKFP
ncbi:nickel-type superoxide dismutase maturation protease [Crocosphaera sp.]|uniref:nickel-type superoxide dismutase maturation protease n=1 Tax=Crocosphaera sp. TaxID=2729996 RepID=UPI0026258B58|nr:nickel-type superoxide dismutase maturation protease [Crocosphaera sp.]MDJ0582284.1 nickel-type superoxide dismutase maturation protease [Crocosphaera sp.]